MVKVGSHLLMLKASEPPHHYRLYQAFLTPKWLRSGFRSCGLIFRTNGSVHTVDRGLTASEGGLVIKSRNGACARCVGVRQNFHSSSPAGRCLEHLVSRIHVFGKHAAFRWQGKEIVQNAHGVRGRGVWRT